MKSGDGVVDYESFGAKGDGVADDLPAIVAAHAWANEHGAPVRSRPDATYHLGYRDLTAIIATSTDWNTSRFTVDDSDTERIESHRQTIFDVCSLDEPVEIEITSLHRDQRRLDSAPALDCYVFVEQADRLRYIRRGPNQNTGVPQTDCFVARSDGSIEGDIDWEYDRISRIEAHPLPQDTLEVTGGVFATLANREHHPQGYNYWRRGILIRRSNTLIRGLIHYVTGETDVGCPYSGFLTAQECANVAFRDCFATPHKVYLTIGAAGVPVTMGSYDYTANNVVGFTMIGCKQHLIHDRTRWGVIGTNHCKNIVLEDCRLSRMDTHMGVSGDYIVRRCTLGHMGLNAIGRGRLVVEESTLAGRALVNFRSDYGSTWEGSLEIRNCRWTPRGDGWSPLALIGVSNDGMHDFGYPCTMPGEVTIDGLVIEDENAPDDFEGPYILSDPDAAAGEPLPTERPFPYGVTRRITLRDVRTESGHELAISPNPRLSNEVQVSA